MNPQMWQHPATRRNLAHCGRRHPPGRPEPGDMACGEVGIGRMAEPEQIHRGDRGFADTGDRNPAGVRALVTSGPTVEAIDPVRFIANRSSGKQGHAIAAALRAAGCRGRWSAARCTSGPARGAGGPGRSAAEMLAACEAALPVRVAVCAAAVADWRRPPRRAARS